jgi:hypothetical protein
VHISVHSIVCFCVNPQVSASCSTLSKNIDKDPGLPLNFGADGWFRPSMVLDGVASIFSIGNVFVWSQVRLSSSGHVAGMNLGNGLDSDDMDVSSDVVNWSDAGVVDRYAELGKAPKN